MREVELKAVVDDLRDRRARVEEGGATLEFVGRLEDRRYDTRDRTLLRDDVVLRLRVYRNAKLVQGHLDWKGPTRQVDGFKVREELSTAVGDPIILAQQLERLGYVVLREIDREIVQYRWRETTIRFERYPRMDLLVEVEGTPEGIEAAIELLGMPRAAFTAERLPDFVRAYETRTGLRAALSDRELSGTGWRSMGDG
jgi:adenylate cyclase class IV